MKFRKVALDGGTFHEVFCVGFRDAVQTSLGIFKIMIPVSLLMAVLNALGVVGRLSVLFQPISGLLGLSGQSILVLLSGYLINTYSAIALMISLELSMKEMSILSGMILLSHTLPVELSIQKKAGGKMWLLFLIRVGSSIVTGMILNVVIPSGTGIMDPGERSALTAGAFSLTETLKAWVLENGITIIKIFIINIIINIVFKLLMKLQVIDKLGNLFKPVMFLFGLAKEAAPYWLITNMIGLIYGAGILITANENHSLDKEEIGRLNISVCAMHSIIQETANFLVLGVPICFLIIPRLITAVLSVWLYRLFIRIRRRSGTVHNG